MIDRHPFHTGAAVPQPAGPDRRANRLMREFIDLVAHNVDAGQITTRRAGELMNSVGVPFEVACRVLPKRSPCQ